MDGRDYVEYFAAWHSLIPGPSWSNQPTLNGFTGAFLNTVRRATEKETPVQRHQDFYLGCAAFGIVAEPRVPIQQFSCSAHNRRARSRQVGESLFHAFDRAMRRCGEPRPPGHGRLTNPADCRTGQRSSMIRHAAYKRVMDSDSYILGAEAEAFETESAAIRAARTDPQLSSAGVDSVVQGVTGFG